MAKYSKKMVEKIVGLIKSDTYTIAEICRQVGINTKTYHEWINTHEDFAQAVEDGSVISVTQGLKCLSMLRQRPGDGQACLKRRDTGFIGSGPPPPGTPPPPPPPPPQNQPTPPTPPQPHRGVNSLSTPPALALCVLLYINTELGMY